MERTFITVLQQFGILPTLIIIIAVVWFFLREIRREVGRLTEVTKRLEEKFASQLEELRSSFAERDAQHQEALSALDRRIQLVEREYVSKEDHYRDIGGWREEMREMRRTLDAFLMRMKGDV